MPATGLPPLLDMSGRHSPTLRIWLSRDLSPLGLLACAAILFCADWAYRRAGTSIFPAAPLDEIAHFLTALMLLALLPGSWRARVIGPALLASVAIDLDHIPQYLGYGFLTAGTPRPYAHSLLTLAVLLGLALALRHHRRLPAALALGVVLHFLRDLAEGNGSGVALLWPLSDHPYSYPHAAYLALMACVTGLALCRVLLVRGLRLRSDASTRGQHHSQRAGEANRRQASRASA